VPLRAGYDWQQDARTGRWRLWEFDPSQRIDQWYNEGSGRGRGRLVRDQDGRLLPGFESVDAGTEWLRQHRWGRVILGVEN
jgi:hypothetical protein